MLVGQCKHSRKEQPSAVQQEAFFFICFFSCSGCTLKLATLDFPFPPEEKISKC